MSDHLPLPRVRQAPTDPAFYANPYPTYAAMRGAGDLVFWEDYGFWCAAGYERVSALLRDRRFGREITHVATRAELGWPEIPEHLAPFYAFEAHSMLEREPPTHTRLRGLVNRAFVSRAIDRLKPTIAAIVDAALDRMIARRGQATTHDQRAGEPASGLGFAAAATGLVGAEAVDLVEAFATPVPVETICALLGVDVRLAPQMLAWSHAMVGMYQFGRTRAEEDAAVAATLAFSELMRGIIDARRGAPGDDLLSDLIAAADGSDRLSEDELITTAILLLNAGHEATVHAIANAVPLILSVEPERRPALFRDDDATERTVEECLRYDPPLHLFTRYALDDVEIGPVRFRRGDRVGLLLAAANRDPDRWAIPDCFDPDRPVQPHASFGAGIHFCVGAALARAEIGIALPRLIDRMPRLALVSDPVRRDAYHFNGYDRLAVTW